MNRTIRDTGYPACFSADRTRRPKTSAWHTTGSQTADIFQFDADAWVALLDEQKLLIAAAAGVDPSKVRIHVGH